MDYRGTVKVMSSRGPRAPVPVAGSWSNSARQVPVAPWLISKPDALAGACVPVTLVLMLKLAEMLAE